jgi:AGZA family xanthine/uracil permease-like MFS transporter
MAGETTADSTASGESATEANGRVGRWCAEVFGFAEYGTDLRTEILAGITTFVTMSYMVVVIPTLMAGVPGKNGNPGIIISGMSPNAVQQMLAVVTIITAVIAIFVMAFYANRPFAQGPGLGLAPFFAYTVVGGLGVPWPTALAAVFVEGLLFVILTLIGAREIVANVLPEPVKLSIGTGIGLFLAIVGLKEMEVIVDDPATLVSLGHIASNPIALLSVVGLFLTLMLYTRGITGSIIIGILCTGALGYVVTFLGWVPPGVLAPKSLPNAHYNVLPLVGAFIQGFQNVDAFVFSMIVFTFFFVDFFDATGSITGVGQLAGLLDEDGNLPEIDKALMADAIGTTVAGILGTSAVTTYVESATGVEEGGRTGMTAFVVGLLFLAALVIVPLAAAIPVYASHIALVVVALLMMQNVVDIDWSKLTHAIPAGLTIIVMPLTYSIAYGMAVGIISYPLMKTAAGEWDEIGIGQWLLAGAFIVYFFVRTSGFLQTTI